MSSHTNARDAVRAPRVCVPPISLCIHPLTPTPTPTQGHLHFDERQQKRNRVRESGALSQESRLLRRVIHDRMMPAPPQAQMVKEMKPKRGRKGTNESIYLIRTMQHLKAIFILRMEK